MSTETAHEPFTVDDEGKAAWAVDKILSARERAERIKRQCQEMINQAAQEAADTEAFFLPLLEAWYDANPPRKGKSIKLPTGTLSRRTVPGGPRIVNDGACMEWAKAQGIPGLIRVVESLSRTAVTEYVKTTGDLPNGVERVESRETFGVH